VCVCACVRVRVRVCPLSVSGHAPPLTRPDHSHRLQAGAQLMATTVSPGGGCSISIGGATTYQPGSSVPYDLLVLHSPLLSCVDVDRFLPPHTLVCRRARLLARELMRELGCAAGGRCYVQCHRDVQRGRRAAKAHGGVVCWELGSEFVLEKRRGWHQQSRVGHYSTLVAPAASTAQQSICGVVECGVGVGVGVVWGGVVSCGRSAVSRHVADGISLWGVRARPAHCAGTRAQSPRRGLPPQ
jgi:hypothetical protein